MLSAHDDEFLRWKLPFMNEQEVGNLLLVFLQ